MSVRRGACGRACAWGWMSPVLWMATVALCGCNGSKVAESDLYNVQARLDAGGSSLQATAGRQGTRLPYPVLQWQAITVSVDRGADTMATLFGDDAAVAAARAGRTYPAGAVLGLVTWRERSDPHWFGARIPGRPLSVEFVVVGSAQERLFVGTPWREVAGSAGRVAAIEGMKAAMAP